MREITSSVVLAAIACLAVQSIFAQAPAYSDDEVKAQFLKAGTFRHAEFINGAYRRSFEMADCDTNRYARILREIVVEHTNETRRVIRSLGRYRTQQSLPFLYSYATNAQYGAYSLKSIFAIEGVTSNSVAAVHNYLFMSNQLSLAGIDERSDTCTDLLKRVCSDPSLVEYRPGVLDMATSFIQNVELMPNVLDGALCNVQDGFRFSKRRLSILRSAMQRVATELSEITVSDCEREGKIHCYTFQTNYLQNAINELVAYPEANLPD